MRDWPFANLGELAAPSDGAIAIGPFGSAMKADTYVADGVRVIRGTNISDTRSWKGDWVHVSEEFVESMPRCEVRPGDLVFPHRGSIGEVAIIPDDGMRYFLSTSLMKATISRALADPTFVYYYLKSASGKHEILRFGSQVGTPGIGQPLTSLRQFRVPLPPLPEQAAISSMLSALDDKIELNRRMNETLEAMARALFKDWFVDFGPTRAKMDGRAPYLAPDIWPLFPDRLDDDVRPHSWEVFSLDMLANQHTASVTPSNSPDEVFDHFSLPAYDAGQTPIRDWGSDIRSAKILIPNGVVLLSKLNPEIERVWVPEPATGRRQVCSTEFLVFTPKANATQPLLFGLFTEPSFRTMLQSMVTGTSNSHQRISPSALMHRPVLVGSAPAFARYAGAVAPLIHRVLANRAEARTLAATRDLILPKLMSGQIRLRDAEQMVEAVA